MQKLEPPSKIVKLKIQRGSSVTKVNKTMNCFSTEPLYARSTLSSTKRQESSLRNNLTSYACYRDTSSASGNPKAGEGQSWESVLGIPTLYLPSELPTQLPCHRLHFLTMLEFALPKMTIPSSEKLLTRIKVRWTVHFWSGKITACFTLHLSLQPPTFYLRFLFGSEVMFLLDCLQGGFVSLGHNHTSKVNGPELKQKKNNLQHPPVPNQPPKYLFS